MTPAWLRIMCAPPALASRAGPAIKRQSYSKRPPSQAKREWLALRHQHWPASTFDDLVRETGEHGHQFLALLIGHLELRQGALDVLHRDLPVARADFEARVRAVFMSWPR